METVSSSPKTARRVLILEDPESSWADYLAAFFEDSGAEIFRPGNPEEAKSVFDRVKPEICFVNPKQLSISLLQKIKVRSETDTAFHLFQIGDEKDPLARLPYLDWFHKEERGIEFLHRFTKSLKLPDKIRILIAEDEAEIRSMISDYLERSLKPAFEIVFAEDGIQAFEKIQAEVFEMALLDFRMPGKDGLEVYAYLQSLERKIPVMVYMDIFSSQQVMDFYQLGRPLIVDKGGMFSSMASLAALIKKTFYFESRG